jgi:L-rhamnonate dehydratase
MKIAAVRCIKLTGSAGYGATEERKVDLLDAYPALTSRKPADRTPNGRVSAIYVEVLTDGGVSGLFGPIFDEAAALIRSRLGPALIGKDPLAYEHVWDLLYRHAYAFGGGGGKGYQMMAISALDLALWDLRGKLAGRPVCSLIGGPTQTTIKCYASMLGYSLEPGRVRERARQMVECGYAAQKWFFRHGPADGNAGIELNVALVRTVREAVGSNIDIMFDCSMAWDPPYTTRVLERIAEFRPYWIEEPLPPEGISNLATIRHSTRIPLASGEHEYTRWGFQQLLQTGAVDVVQPDPEWCGGITETLKICALASAYGRPVFPHGHSISAAWNLICAQPPTVCPMLEFLCNFQSLAQHFHTRYLEPVNGVMPAPDAAGLGIELDPLKIEEPIDL